jgi:branched-subunit amino acid transport protein AzlD
MRTQTLDNLTIRAVVAVLRWWKRTTYIRVAVGEGLSLAFCFICLWIAVFGL